VRCRNADYARRPHPLSRVGLDFSLMAAGELRPAPGAGWPTATWVEGPLSGCRSSGRRPDLAGSAGEGDCVSAKWRATQEACLTRAPPCCSLARSFSQVQQRESACDHECATYKTWRR